MTKARGDHGVRRLLERAAAGDDPLEELLAAWTLVPAVEIAEAIECAPLEVDLAHVVADGAAFGLARLAELDRRRDPRVSAALVEWCAQPPWHATAAQPFYKALLARIEALADPRAVDQLGLAAAGVARVIRGRSMRTWMLDRIARTREVLTAAYPSGAPALASAEQALVARAAQAIAAGVPSVPRQTSETRVVEDLLAAVRSDPSDDAARQVYADALLERGDPRGELITRQLARRGRHPTVAQETAELALVRKHVRAWLGELAPVCGELRQEDVMVGPERTGYGSVRFERGFLVECTLVGTAAKLAHVVRSPQLATVEVLVVDEPYPALLLDAQLPAVVTLGVPASLVAVAAGSSVGQRLSCLTIYGSGATEELMEAVGAAASLSALRTLELHVDERTLEPLALVAIDAAMSIRHLQRIEVSTNGLTERTFKRAGNRWVGADDESKELLARVRG